MEKRHQPTDMGEHRATFRDNKVSLDFTMQSIGIQFQPVFKIADGKLIMDMSQRTNGEKTVSYSEEFGKTKPTNPSQPEPVTDFGKTAQDFTGVWVNKNEQSNNIENLTIENIDANRVRGTMVKVHPEKNLGTYLATVQNNKIKLNFSATGYQGEPVIFFQNGTLVVMMKQAVMGEDNYVSYTEYYRKTES